MALAALLGLLFGSFGGTLVARVPAGEGVVRGRSRCDACRHELEPLDLIPVVSWLVRRGRCRHCGTRITAIWSALELASAAAFGIAVSVAPDPWSAAILAPFLGTLLVLAVIDIRTRRLPNLIVGWGGALAAGGVVVAEFLGGSPSLVSGLAGAAAYGGFLWTVYEVSRRAYGQEAMGFGDVKLAGLIGFVVGAVDLGSVAVAAAATVLLGGLVGVIALVRGMGRRAAIPYGPLLVAGAFVAVVAGPRLFSAYTSLYP